MFSSKQKGINALNKKLLMVKRPSKVYYRLKTQILSIALLLFHTAEIFICNL